MSSKHPRRVFLHTAGSVVAVACAARALAGCSGKPGAASGPIAAGNVKSVPVGTLEAVGGQPVILGRDSGGLYALTALCTHDQCDMTTDGKISPSGIFCSCHGSRFDPNGKVVAGPARAALAHYKVDLAADGSITIQAGTVVDAATRTPVTGS